MRGNDPGVCVDQKLSTQVGYGLLASGMLALIPAALILPRDPNNIFEWRVTRGKFVGVTGLLRCHFAMPLSKSHHRMDMNLTDGSGSRSVGS